MIKHLLAPSIAPLAAQHKIRVELFDGANPVSLSRREADIAIKIDDKPPHIKAETEQIQLEQLGVLRFAVYHQADVIPDDLPWAGLLAEHVRTTGSETMLELAGSHGLQFLVRHFDSLKEIVASGTAKAMLPRCIADDNTRLQVAGETVLEQPLWMLFHKQDQDIHHLKSTREWIRQQAIAKLL